jgi:hypothetical protein
MSNEHLEVLNRVVQKSAEAIVVLGESGMKGRT